jgi:hypothetical protein
MPKVKESCHLYGFLYTLNSPARERLQILVALVIDQHAEGVPQL